MRKNLMKHMTLLFALLFVAATQSCKEDDIYKNIVDGLDATINLKVTVPSAQTITNTRAAEDVESEVKDLWLVMFSSQNPRVEIIDLTGLASSEVSGTNNGYRTYTFDIKNITTKTGNYTAYLLANATSNFCGLTLEALQAVTTPDAFEALMATATEKIQISGSSRIPMVAKIANEVVIQSEKKTVTISATLERLMSRIEFYIIDGTPEGATFTPKSYKVFNVPKYANLVSQTDNTLTAEQFGNTTKMDTCYFNSAQVDLNMTDVPTTSAAATTPAFSFLMHENVRPAGFVGVTDDKLITNPNREAWDIGSLVKPTDGNYTVVNPENKTFTNAPQYSTFVVINGVYEGKSSSTSEDNYRGNVSYTVHLGDFNTDKTNFSVKRNELHKYRITVSGVTSITNEVSIVTIGGGAVPGAEGVLIKSDNNFVLDSHYESLILTLTGDEMDAIKTTWEGNGTKIAQKSPYDNFVYTVYTQDKFQKNTNIDYSWIVFMKPLVSGEIPRFPGYVYRNDGTLVLDTDADATTYGGRGPTDGYVNQVLLNKQYKNATIDEYKSTGSSVYKDGVAVNIGYLNDFCANPYTYAKETSTGSGKYEVAVFVDEYVYSTANPKNKELKIDRWVNTDDRMIIVNPEQIAVSSDNQSIVYNNFIFSIAQRSIKTPYNLDELMSTAAGSAFNSAFGLETYDETSDISGGDTKTGGVPVYNALTTSYTYEITKANGDTEEITITGNSETGATGAAYHEIYGRLNTMALHNNNAIDPGYFKWSGYNNATENQLTNDFGTHTWSIPNANKPNAIQAVLMRNRDLNGNGAIDDNEVRWYMPALAQYYTVWIAQTAMDPETYLMNLKDFYTSTYQTSANITKYPHYFSSSGGSALVYYQDQGISIAARGNLGSSWLTNEHFVRAVRNIPEFNKAPEFPVRNDATNRIIYIEGVADEYLRNENFTGPHYPFHVERDDWNMLPEKIEVSTGDYYITSGNANTFNCSGKTASAMNTSLDAIFSGNANDQNLLNQDGGTQGLNAADKAKSGWRIPNQRELMLLFRYGYLQHCNTTDEGVFYVCGTWYTHNPSSATTTHTITTTSSKTCPFTANAGRMNLDEENFYGGTLRVVLVRDAD